MTSIISDRVKRAIEAIVNMDNAMLGSTDDFMIIFESKSMGKIFALKPNW